MRKLNIYVAKIIYFVPLSLLSKFKQIRFLMLLRDNLKNRAYISGGIRGRELGTRTTMKPPTLLNMVHI